MSPLATITARSVVPCVWCDGRYTVAELQRHLDECRVLEYRRMRRVATDGCGVMLERYRAVRTAE